MALSLLLDILILVIMGLIVILALVQTGKGGDHSIFTTVPGLYMAYKYDDNHDCNQWDPMITTLPGLYIACI